MVAVKPFSRVVLCALLMASAVVAEEVDDVDRTDFSDPALTEDKPAAINNGPHSEVSPASLLPELADDGKVPVGITNYLLTALVNSGGKMFNVSKIEGSLQQLDGKVLQKLKKYEFGEPLGPREQRSYRYPFSISAEQPLGEARLVLSVHYANREKDKFTDVVFNEIVELVPQPPAKVDPMVLAAAGGAALLLLLIVGCAGLRRGSRSPGAGAKKSKAASPVAGNEWLADTLAGTEGRPARARKQTKKRD